jgi:predicted RNase H-like HicB family nuclease
VLDQPKCEIDIFWSEEDGGYIANVPELKYCSAFGETYEEALREALVAMELHLDVLQETGRPVPEPRRYVRTDGPQAKSIDEAAEEFADAVIDSYQAVIEGAVSAQELSPELTQQFFNDVINNLRAQAEGNQETIQQLADQQRRMLEAPQQLTQESIGAYMDFINSIFSFYQGSVERARHRPGDRDLQR